MRKSWMLLPLVAGCAPLVANATMDNPAKTQEKLSVAQEQEIGPVKENHRYKVGLSDFTGKSVTAHIKLVDVGPCAQPKSYSFTLVNDRGARFDMTPAGDSKATTEKGQQELTLDVVEQDGTFAAPVTGDDKALTVEMRPAGGNGCPSIDFRWTFR
jgi:hypothetical protein